MDADARRRAIQIILKYEHLFNGVEWGPLTVDIAAALAQAVQTERERIAKLLDEQECTCGWDECCRSDAAHSLASDLRGR